MSILPYLSLAHGIYICASISSSVDSYMWPGTSTWIIIMANYGRSDCLSALTARARLRRSIRMHKCNMLHEGAMILSLMGSHPLCNVGWRGSGRTGVRGAVFPVAFPRWRKAVACCGPWWGSRRRRRISRGFAGKTRRSLGCWCRRRTRKRRTRGSIRTLRLWRMCWFRRRSRGILGLRWELGRVEEDMFIFGVG